MGIVRMGPPKDIIIFLKEKCNCLTFIETGTFHGWTSFWASKNFTNVKTIEFSKEIYETTKDRFKELENIDFIFGDSRTELKKLMAEHKSNSLFWLDAHWCGSNSYGEEDQCPLMEEIEIINTSKADSIILIDDARLFLSPPPLPNSSHFYPGIAEVIEKLTKTVPREVMVYEDVIISFPEKIKDDFIAFMQNKITADHKKISKQHEKQYGIKKIRRTIKKAIGYKYWPK